MAGPTKQRRERMAAALRLREQGLGYREIAARLGVSHGMAHRDVQDALREITKEPAESVVLLELARLDRLLSLSFRYAENGEVQGITAAVKTMERRAKYLGLDDAAKIDVTGEVRSKLDELLDAAPALPATPAPTPAADPRAALTAAGLDEDTIAKVLAALKDAK